MKSCASELDGASCHDLGIRAGTGLGRLHPAASPLHRRADALLTRQLEKDRDRLFAKAIAQREALFARAVNAADYSTAARILRDRDRTT